MNNVADQLGNHPDEYDTNHAPCDDPSDSSDPSTTSSHIDDQPQRIQALNPQQSFIVQAPAGSGKTELLIQRYLTLLNCVNRPEEILAITFTKKASNEMRARVLNALKQAAYEPEPATPHELATWRLSKQALQRDRELSWNLINNPNQLRIQTIDSLCSYLTKQLPLLSHFGSAPAIAPQAIGLYRAAAQEVLSHIEENFEWSQAIANLLLHLDNDLNKVETLIIQLLAKRDQWLPYIHFDTNSAHIRAQLEEQLGWVINDELTNLRNLFSTPLANELMTIARYATHNLANSPDKNKSDIIACRDYQHIPDAEAAHLRAWQGIAKLLLTNDGEWRKRIDISIGMPPATQFDNQQEKLLASTYKQQLADIIMQLNSNDNLRATLFRITQLPAATYTDTQWEILKSLLQVLKITAAQLRVVFQQTGQIDFIENAQAALLALGNDDAPTDLALALDYQIRHILMDEFQDTSLTQYQLLEKLIIGWEPNDGRTLFVVGDPMQSIYRFREAEVGLFIRMWKQGIAQLQLIPLRLSVNFRSRTAIVEWNNKQFSHIFPTFNDIATGAVSYSKSTAINLNADANISIQGFADADKTTQADHIVKLIQQLRATSPNDSMAILVRSRSHLSSLIPVLKRAGIPYRAVEIDPLSSKQFILDLLSLTSALLHPADRIAWLAVLRAPWCGLTLADLYCIANQHPYATIWELIDDRAIIQSLSSDGQQRLTRLHAILKTALGERERHQLRTWIETTWQALGGPASLQNESEIDAANSFFDLINELTCQEHMLDIQHLQDRIDQLYAPSQQQDTTLQIMTIHTAKGLEFDTVILPHLERKNPVDEKPLLLWADRPLSHDKSALLLAPIQAFGENQDRIYEFIRLQQRIKSDYETDRLFYVATTRAKKQLHLFFNISRTEKGHFKIESGSFLEKLWLMIEKDAFNIIQHSHIHEQDATQQAIKSLQRLTSNWQNPFQPTHQSNVAYHQQKSGFSLVDPTPRLMGTIIHFILQTISNQGISWWKQLPNQLAYVQLQLQQSGINPVQLNDAKQFVISTINTVLQDDRGKWILHEHVDAKSELALTVTLNNEIHNIVIDRTFIDETGTRWIIDYKTTALSTNDLENFLENEQKKYVEQMQKYQQAMKILDNRPIKLGLYFPALPAWREWE